MDFAPYQDVSPETSRALSPPPVEGRRSFSPTLGSPTKATSPLASPWGAVSSSTPNAFGNDGAGQTSGLAGSGGNVSGGWGGNGGGYFGGNNGDAESGRIGRLNEFETSLPIRLDYEACLAYLLLPPAGGVLLLMFERKSDYVRFHAWQSSLLFSAIFVVHLIFSWWAFISWVLFVGDVALIAYLTMRAYRDADTLDRCEVPFFGQLASSILDDE